VGYGQRGGEAAKRRGRITTEGAEDTVGEGFAKAEAAKSLYEFGGTVVWSAAA